MKLKEFLDDILPIKNCLHDIDLVIVESRDGSTTYYDAELVFEEINGKYIAFLRREK